MFLGVDVGTSGVKVVLLDEDGRLRDQGFAPLNLSRPHPLWSEQDPDAWWAATSDAVQSLDQGLRLAVSAVGLAGQMHGATLLGANHRPLRPAILWNDGRSFAECIELERAVPQIREITGNLVMPGFTAPKLLWVRRQEPAVFRQLRTVLLPKDYVRLRLTGELASDVSDSAGTLWLDMPNRRWSEAVLSACELSTKNMPSLFEGPEVTGMVRREVAAAWGIASVPVVAGGSDNAAGAAGAGVVREGDALLSLGTSGVIFAATERFRPNPTRAVHAFCHCLPGIWHQMTVHLSSAACIGWLARITGGTAADVLARAEESGICGPELFLPYLSGERTPYNDPHVRGAFLCLDNETDAGRLAAAVLQGVAFALADGMAALRDGGTVIQQLSVIGGGGRSTYWGRLIATLLDVPLAFVRGGDVGPALGAAQLARTAMLRPGSLNAFQRPDVSHLVAPDPTLRQELQDKYAKFRDAYLRVKPSSDPAAH